MADAFAAGPDENAKLQHQAMEEEAHQGNELVSALLAIAPSDEHEHVQ